jgi:hypothetical protein
VTCPSLRRDSGRRPLAGGRALFAEPGANPEGGGGARQIVFIMDAKVNLTEYCVPLLWGLGRVSGMDTDSEAHSPPCIPQLRPS